MSESNGWLRVTQICAAAGLMPDFHGDEFAMTRGTHVHTACEYDDDGTLDMATLDPQLVGYVEAWRRFKAESGFIIRRSEMPVTHPTLEYRGRLDRLINRGMGDPLHVLDIKSGSPMGWHGVQTALYQMAAAETMAPSPEHSISQKRYGCYLKNDGTCNLETWTDRNDFADAKAAVRIARRRIADGLCPDPRRATA